MASQIPEDITHTHHCMLLEFHKDSHATKTVAVDARKCQRWFSKFRFGNFDLSDSPRTGRPTTLGNDILRAEMEAKWSTIQEHFQQISKTNRAGVWVLHNPSE